MHKIKKDIEKMSNNSEIKISRDNCFNCKYYKQNNCKHNKKNYDPLIHHCMNFVDKNIFIHLFTTILENIEWKFKDLKSLKNKIIYGIENIFNWFIIIWSDRDWDEHYFFLLIRKKLDNMSKYFDKYGNFEGYEDVSKTIKEAKYLCDLIINGEKDYYAGEISSNNEKKLKGDFFSKKINNNFYELIDLNGNKEKETLKEIKNPIIQEEKDREKNINKLFDLLKNNIRKFWL